MAPEKTPAAYQETYHAAGAAAGSQKTADPIRGTCCSRRHHLTHATSQIWPIGLVLFDAVTGAGRGRRNRKQRRMGDDEPRILNARYHRV